MRLSQKKKSLKFGKWPRRSRSGFRVENPFQKKRRQRFLLRLEMPLMPYDPGGSKKVEGRRRRTVSDRAAGGADRHTKCPPSTRLVEGSASGGSDDDRHGLFGPESGAPRLALCRGKQGNSRRVRFIFSAYIISSVAGAAKEGEGREVDDAARHGVRSEESGMPANRRAAAREGRRAPWRSGEILVLLGIIHGEVSPPPSPSLVSPRMVSRSPPSSH